MRRWPSRSTWLLESWEGEKRLAAATDVRMRTREKKFIILMEWEEGNSNSCFSEENRRMGYVHFIYFRGKSSSPLMGKRWGSVKGVGLTRCLRRGRRWPHVSSGVPNSAEDLKKFLFEL
ncbi:hypothetical protein HPP92_005385 [Vanilla planifolia]|uniref:Uncharacterized protein n=1 Tax=Vanilla planifolia TaxID=51239 RepID=A0A835RJ12_VANPL|nr:hypothetical protein HPP92_005687 [Vanilla planifolia]KAG0494391.1 hypothetical protein HPP92_005385 [Vanilla planifolia]